VRVRWCGGRGSTTSLGGFSTNLCPLEPVRRIGLATSSPRASRLAARARRSSESREFGPSFTDAAPAVGRDPQGSQLSLACGVGRPALFSGVFRGPSGRVTSMGTFWSRLWTGSGFQHPTRPSVIVRSTIRRWGHSPCAAKICANVGGRLLRYPEATILAGTSCSGKSTYIERVLAGRRAAVLARRDLNTKVWAHLLARTHRPIVHWDLTDPCDPGTAAWIYVRSLRSSCRTLLRNPSGTRANARS
jgi:hypothetical protein